MKSKKSLSKEKWTDALPASCLFIIYYLFFVRHAYDLESVPPFFPTLLLLILFECLEQKHYYELHNNRPDFVFFTSVDRRSI